MRCAGCDIRWRHGCCRWTRDESAERFPNVITPLAWEMVEDGFHRSLNHSFQLMGYPAFSGKWFAIFDHYIYGNQNAVEIYGRRMPRRTRKGQAVAVKPLKRQQLRSRALPHTRKNAHSDAFNRRF